MPVLLLSILVLLFSWTAAHLFAVPTTYIVRATHLYNIPVFQTLSPRAGKKAVSYLRKLIFAAILIVLGLLLGGGAWHPTDSPDVERLYPKLCGFRINANSHERIAGQRGAGTRHLYRLPNHHLCQRVFPAFIRIAGKVASYPFPHASV